MQTAEGIKKVRFFKFYDRARVAIIAVATSIKKMSIAEA